MPNTEAHPQSSYEIVGIKKKKEDHRLTENEVRTPSEWHGLAPMHLGPIEQLRGIFFLIEKNSAIKPLDFHTKEIATGIGIFHSELTT